MTEKANGKGPLSGVKVVDVSSVISGPCATGMLADQGAQVIKVEPPSGDIMRARGKVSGFTPSFVSCNRGKRSVTLDLKKPEAKEILWKLIEDADVFVQNFRPGVADRLGFGADEALGRNPRLVYLSISGVGDSGPYVGKRVYDPVVQSLSGLADIQQDPLTKRPKMIRSVIADKTTALYAAQAVTAALFSRSQTGEGQHVQVSMLDAMLNYNWIDGMTTISVVGQEEEPSNTPHDMIFPTADGFVTIGAISNKEWIGLCQAIERPDLIDDPRFATPSQREVNRQERLELLEYAVSDRKTEALLTMLESHDVPCAPVLRRQQVLDDPQVLHNDVITVLDQQGLGPTRQAQSAAKFSATATGPLSQAPALGEHTLDVLAELGLSEQDIVALRDSQTIS
ncbi:MULTISPECIES: CaiB/BaiF CoA-transferase family protein [unclassified Ruegeria]|uniref:CaiB/BaiF CoA transferase family protein n=1 Tax=unclassified Ruegeria TaxID=2625375 RepID=UPI00148839C7|nr:MULTISPECIES: CoA transferase [unclassified Ruegeria]